MDSFLYITQLRIPPQPHRAIHRTRLIHALEYGIVDYKLTLISAPAGYGKTTLLAQWAQSSVLPTAWLTISPEDNDLERFLRSLLKAWAEVQPEVVESKLGRLLGALSPDTEASLSAFLNAANDLPDHTVFVLDDFHRIEDSAIHQMLTFLIDHLPPKLHIVLAGRADPPLPLARYRARHELLELTIRDLEPIDPEIVDRADQPGPDEHTDPDSRAHQQHER